MILHTYMIIIIDVNRIVSATILFIMMHGEILYTARTDCLMMKNYLFETCRRYFVNETNRRTEFQFYWCYHSICFGQPFCPSSGVLSRTSSLVHLMQIWWPFVTRSRMARVRLA